MPDVLEIMRGWIEGDNGRCHFVVNTCMQGTIIAHRDPEFRRILESADLFTPAGFSIDSLN